MKHSLHFSLVFGICFYMLGYVITIMLILGFTFSIAGGNASEALGWMLQGCNSAVELMLSLAGSYLLWLGIMNVAKRAGLIDKLALLTERPLRKLMPNCGDASAPVTLNLAANFFGLGNAATPFGLEAMKRLSLADPRLTKDGIASDNICMFLALNASVIVLLPVGVLAIRAACGSSAPNSIVLPTFLSSVISAISAILLCKLFSRRKTHGSR